MRERLTYTRQVLENVFVYMLIPLLSLCFFQTRFLFFLSPLPLIFGYLRYGRMWGTLLSLFSIIGIIMLESNDSVLLFLLIAVLLATVFSELARRKLAVEQIFLRSIIIILACYLGTLFIFSKGHPYSFIYQKVYGTLAHAPLWLSSQQETMLKSWKIEPAQLDQWKLKAAQIATDANTITVSFLKEKLFGYGISLLILVLWFSTVLLDFFGVRLASNDLKRWKTPDHLVWVFIAVFLFHEIQVPILTTISKNFIVVLAVIYFLQGLSIAAYYFSYKKFTSGQRGLGYTLLVLFPFFTACFGFFDLWINFRAHMGKENQKPVLRPKA